MGGEQSTARPAGDSPRTPPAGYPSAYPSGAYQRPYPAYDQQEPPVAQPYPAYPPYARPPPSHSSSFPQEEVQSPYPRPPPPSHSSSFPAYQAEPQSQPPPGYPAPGPAGGGSQGRFDRMYSRILDNYTSLEEVSSALSRSGLESSNLIVGIDFTKSNEWTGKISFQQRCLHHIGDYQNPYEQAISIIGRTLSFFDEDNLIPCFGFGDASTHDKDVFSFYPNGQPCRGFEDVLSRYKQLVPHTRLSGPTSFAPVIEMAMSIVEKSGGQYHVLLIIADGQVTRSVDLGHGQLSSQERRTYDALVRASHYPLSIVLVGVGDGPWDTMKEFDDNIPSRVFDNFQFVNFTEIMSRRVQNDRKEAEFALRALMEVPLQYKATVELGLLGRRTGSCPEKVPLPPPSGVDGSPIRPGVFQSPSFQENTPSYSAYAPAQKVSNAPNAGVENQVCPICLINSRDMTFGCGHQTCRVCGQLVNDCPTCRKPIETRVRLY